MGSFIMTEATKQKLADAILKKALDYGESEQDTRHGIILGLTAYEQIINQIQE